MSTSSYQKGDALGSYQEVSNGNSLAGGGGQRSMGHRKWMIGAAVVVVAAIAFAATRGGSDDTMRSMTNVDKVISSSDSGLQTDANGTVKLFDNLNRYVLEDYDAKSTWSSFLPAVAGYYGKPVWAFYVNRGQGVATFGTESKDYPIVEFNPANKAYELTPIIAFRTFIRAIRGTTTVDFEPFSSKTARNLQDPDDDPNKPKRFLYVGTNEMEIQEIDGFNELETRAQYFIIPDENFGALVRRATFKNIGDTEVKLDILDGLAKMEPFGGPMDWALKNMGRTAEGWFGVYHADKTLNLPFYKLSTELADTAQVTVEESGNYCIAFIESNTGKAQLLPVVFDMNKVFGQGTTLEKPLGLATSSVREILDNPQYGYSKTSSAFPALTQYTLGPGESVTIASVYGKADSIKKVPTVADRVTAPGYIETKFQRARQITKQLSASVDSSTANPLFDGTVSQMFLDNGLRGGFPTILGNVDGSTTYDEDPGVKVFHSFSRIHGDLERDYNNFDIQPTFFSQGPGNFRDVAQNRRNDVTFTPRMGSYDIQEFLSFVQANAYNPLTVEAVAYRFVDPDVAMAVAKEVTADEESANILYSIFDKGTYSAKNTTMTTGPFEGTVFRPGDIFTMCEENNINKTESMTDEQFINTILAETEDRAMGSFDTGYWADHWDYFMDMIEAYLAVHPDSEETIMYDKSLRYFFSPATVRPRSETYVLTTSSSSDGGDYVILQLESTIQKDKDKKAEQKAYQSQHPGVKGIDADWQRTQAGETFFSSPIAKLFLLGAVKYATRDAYGMGVEYEGGRPGWLDAMNGRPGMIGSGMPETYELYILLSYVKSVVDRYKRHIVVPIELSRMVDQVNYALDVLESSGYVDSYQDNSLPIDVPEPLFAYWDVVASARENYRNDVQYYFSGDTVALKANAVSSMIERWLEQIDLGVERSFAFGTQGFGDDGKSGIPAAYFAYNVTDFVLNDGTLTKDDVKDDDDKLPGLPTVNAKAMRVRTFPLFLEGPVRYMKYKTNDKERLQDIYQRVLKSGLRDNILNMYYLSGSIEGQSYQMGRQVAFAPGWLENQSIWMHMSYKYYLQMLRGKLYDEFFAEFKGGALLPFMDPDVYGRSLMECSSFIASSVFPDPSIVGEGFLPRLSGTTAEFMDIWKHMFIGPKLYFLNDSGALEMQLMPALPSWLFDDSENGYEPMLDADGNHVITFKLFSAIPVTYHNPDGGNLYGVPPKRYKVTMNSGEVLNIESSTIPTDTALEIRQVTNVFSIDAYF